MMSNKFNFKKQTMKNNITVSSMIRNMIKFMFAFAFLFFVASVCAMAQTEPIDPTPELIKSYFGSISLLAGATLIVTAFFRSKISGHPMQYLSWIIAMVLAFIGWGMHWGMFATITWPWVIAAGAGAGLISNGIADTRLIQSIYDSFKNK